MNNLVFTLKQARVGMALSLLLLVSVVFLQACRPASSAEANQAAPTPPEAVTPSAIPYVAAASPIEAGRYLIILGGCNDCHTPGYMEPGVTVPETEWLTGMPVGFRGPWGTTYPANLRLRAQELTEDEWVTMLHTRTMLPPMPWVNVNQLSDQDARAIYQFIKSLGPKGERAPVPVAPGEEPATPYILFEPQHMERLQPQG